MSVLPTGFLAPRDFPFVSPLGTIVGNYPGQQQLGAVIWNFDSSGNNFRLNSNFQINPQNWYTINYEFTVEATAGIPLPSAITVIMRDTLGIIPNPPTLTIPINQYTSGSTAVFQAKFMGTVFLDANFEVQNQNQFQMTATLVPDPSQLRATNLIMTLQKLTIQQLPFEFVQPVNYTVSGS